MEQNKKQIGASWGFKCMLLSCAITARATFPESSMMIILILSMSCSTQQNAWCCQHQLNSDWPQSMLLESKNSFHPHPPSVQKYSYIQLHHQGSNPWAKYNHHNFHGQEKEEEKHTTSSQSSSISVPGSCSLLNFSNQWYEEEEKIWFL
jgi:hypothetical protein